MSFRSAAELFRLIKEERTDYVYSVSVSLFEIYNEEVRHSLAHALARTQASCLDARACKHAFARRCVHALARADAVTCTQWRMRLEWPQCVSVGQLRDLLVDPKLIKAEQRKCGVALRGLVHWEYGHSAGGQGKRRSFRERAWDAWMREIYIGEMMCVCVCVCHVRTRSTDPGLSYCEQRRNQD